ncbi:SPASM domain-containing protein, partial [Streptomyces roseolus]|uniref:SPASM domain-containing protein n=1 Tax=Streptomyces roseolus TaxID=67358 RepID=UPI00364887B8
NSPRSRSTSPNLMTGRCPTPGKITQRNEALLGGCDELPWPQAQLTRLDQVAGEPDIVAAQRWLPLLRQGKDLMERCTACSYRSACGGGCIATRLRYEKDEDQDAYCGYRMRIIDGIAALLAQPAHPDGAGCGTAHWRPRTPNSMRDIDGFLARWNRLDGEHPPVRLSVSACGNINTVGEPGVHEADDLDPSHPQWYEAIEPGVRPLVDAATGSWGCITYDSCQGHLYDGLDMTATERRVGILPRDRAEYARVAAALCRAATVATRELPAPVRVTLGRAELECESSRRRVPVLDLVLLPTSGYSWTAYFAAVDEATRILTAALDHERPTGYGCACTLPSQKASAPEGALS